MYTYEKRVGVNLIPPIGPGLFCLGIEARWCEEEPASGRQKRPVGVNLNSAAQAALAALILINIDLSLSLSLYIYIYI